MKCTSKWLGSVIFFIRHSYSLSVLSGHTRCDGQPAVYPGGNSVEDLLEIQPESGWRCHVGCVSAEDLHAIKKCLPLQQQERSIKNSGKQTVCVSAVTTSQRSVSLSAVWCCCASMTQCCAGAVTVTTACTRAWWRSSSLTSSGPSPVRLSLISDKGNICPYLQ